MKLDYSIVAGVSSRCRTIMRFKNKFYYILRIIFDLVNRLS
jgi:hypothetical protein